MTGDNFYFRDAKMTGTEYRRSMRLTANVNNTAGQRLFFQCGTEEDPFVVDDDGNNHTITLKWARNAYGNIYVGHSENTDNDTTYGAGYYGSAVLNGGTWTCNQLYVGNVVSAALDGRKYTLKVEDGKLILSIKSTGLMVIIK